MNRFGLDTNILIYLHDANQLSYKRDKANELIAQGAIICPQVVSEYLNVCQKRLKMPKHNALASFLTWLPYCELSVFQQSIYTDVLSLMDKYQFQLFDAIIVSSALNSDCTILYSEDMQHNLIVDERLKIINPFI